MRLLPVAADDIDDAWPLIERHIARACDEAPHLSPEDVREAIKLKDMSAWALVNGHEAVGVLVAQIVIWPQIKVARLVLAACDDGYREVWMTFRPALERWAKSYGCELMEVFGRAGWAKVIPNARVRSVVEWRIA